MQRHKILLLEITLRHLKAQQMLIFFTMKTLKIKHELYLQIKKGLAPLEKYHSAFPAKDCQLYLKSRAKTPHDGLS